MLNHPSPRALAAQISVRQCSTLERKNHDPLCQDPNGSQSLLTSRSTTVIRFFPMSAWQCVNVDTRRPHDVASRCLSTLRLDCMSPGTLSVAEPFCHPASSGRATSHSRSASDGAASPQRRCLASTPTQSHTLRSQPMVRTPMTSLLPNQGGSHFQNAQFQDTGTGRKKPRFSHDQ